MIAEMKAGDRLPSVTDLEKHFGVAKATVVAAVAELQTEGLVVCRQGSGTFVTAAGQADSDQKAKRPLVGRILITSTTIGSSLDIFSAMVATLESEMRGLGYDPVVHFEREAGPRIAHARQRWESRAVDGFIHLGSLTEEAAFGPGVPGVVIGELSAGTQETALVHQVVVDNIDGGRRMGQYLCSLGHRRVALIARHNLFPASLRFQGLAKALRECGGTEEDASLVLIDWKDSAHSDIPSLETALRSLLDSPNPPTALFFANDLVAFPALLTLLTWGYRIPQDISVVSFDDTPGLASHTRPGLTGMRMPTLALGALAVQTLHQAILQPTLPFRRLRLPAELIIRESAAPPAVTAFVPRGA
jgi:DNA-binding LacI/PurR family transcriptional regulator